MVQLNPSQIRVLIGCERFGVVREAFAARGFDAWSCDLAESESAGQHHRCDLRDVLGLGWDLLTAHPDCTYLTSSAEWAYKDADFVRYPGVGYHQQVKPGTLTGTARDQAVDFARTLLESDIASVALENPVGALSSRLREPDQTIQPYQFGDDASKRTCLWLRGLPRLKTTTRRAGRLVEWPRGSGRIVERWSNQTDSGQNNLAPRVGRAMSRAKTYAGIAAAMAQQWGDHLIATAHNRRVA